MRKLIAIAVLSLLCKCNLSYLIIYIIFSCLTFISLLISIFYVRESIRYYYEFGLFDIITKELKEILGEEAFNNKLEKYLVDKYTNTDYQLDASESKNNNKSCLLLTFQFVGYSSLIKAYINNNKEKSKRKQFNYTLVKKYPTIFLYLSIMNDEMKKRYLVVFTILISNFFTWFLTLTMLNSNLILKKTLYILTTQTF